MKIINKIDVVFSYIKGSMKNDEFSAKRLNTELQEILELYDLEYFSIFQSFKLKLDAVITELKFTSVNSMFLFEDIEDSYDRIAKEKIYELNMDSLYSILYKYMPQLNNYLTGYSRLKIENLSVSDQQTESIEDMKDEKGVTLFEKYLYLYLSTKHQNSKEADSLLNSKRHISYLAHLFSVTKGTVETMRLKIYAIIQRTSTESTKSQFVERADKILRRMRKDNESYYDDWVTPMIKEMEEIKKFLSNM